MPTKFKLGGRLIHNYILVHRWSFAVEMGREQLSLGLAEGEDTTKLSLMDQDPVAQRERKAQGTECAKAGNVRYPGWLEFQIGVSNGGDEAGEHQRPLTVSLELDPSPGG